METRPPRAHPLTLIVLCTAILALGLQCVVSHVAMGGTAVETLWRMAGYFTVLTNLGVGIVMLAELAGRHASARLAGGTTLAILMVGLVYHTLLARLWNPVGLAWWADQGLHSAVPGLTLLWWLTLAPKSVSLRDLPFWLIWPILYVAYALTRGFSTGFWPYPFLDVTALGWPSVSANLAGITLVFAAIGLGLIQIARRLVG